MSVGGTAEKQPDYPMVGAADGLGIYWEQDKSIVLINHEVKEELGGVRAHGETGAFVSKWVLTEDGIVHGEDLIRRTAFYDRKLKKYQLTPMRFGKLCSGDLPSQSALFFQQDGIEYGTRARIFFSGEELSTKKYKRYGRAFAHVIEGDFAGVSFELPKLGRMAFENVVLSPYPQRYTIAMLTDDASNSTYDAPKDEKAIAAVHKNPPSELYVYVGKKQQSTSNPIEAAGLNNGQLYGVRVEGMFKEDRKQAIKPQTPFKLIALDEPPSDEKGGAMQIQSLERGVSQFLRLEDGAWNPLEGRQNEFFFTTTDKTGGNSRLYRLVFDDIAKPLKGGTLSVELNGNEHGMEKLDNLTIDPWGRILIQEDPGDEARLARIWLYDLNSKKLYEIAQHKARFFSPEIENSEFISSSEESSGIVHAFDSLGEGWYILDVQSHRKHPDPALIEYGQLLKMFVPKELP